MSMRVNTDLGCPECGKSFAASVYRSIWGEFPENRELVFSDQINVVTCPACGFKAILTFSLLYVDMNREFAVWYEPVPDIRIETDSQTYAKMFGPDSFYAKAPRISDWDTFKQVIIEFESGLRRAQRISPEQLKSPLELLKNAVLPASPNLPTTEEASGETADRKRRKPPITTTPFEETSDAQTIVLFLVSISYVGIGVGVTRVFGTYATRSRQ